MERGHQAEQADPHQHVQPAAGLAHHHLHRLGQRVVDVGELAPVAHATGHDHDQESQHHQREDAGDVGDGDGSARLLGLFGGHGRAFDGQEEPDRKRDGGEDAGPGAHGEFTRTGPAVGGEVGQRPAGCDHAGKHQQLGHGQQGHHQLEHRGNAHAQRVEGDEDHVGAQRRDLGVERGELQPQVGTDGQRDRRRREHELHQRGEAGDEASRGPEGAARVGKRAAGVRDGGGEFGEAEDEGGVHQRHEQRGQQEAQRAGAGPAVAPAEIFAGDDQTDGDAPEREGAQHGLELPGDLFGCG
ncbi:hypothetical protein D9M68_626740 [compost metagenome]